MQLDGRRPQGPGRCRTSRAPRETAPPGAPQPRRQPANAGVWYGLPASPCPRPRGGDPTTSRTYNNATDLSPPTRG